MSGGTVTTGVGTETLTITAGTGTFANANVGTKAVTADGYAIADGTNGGLATNYTLSAQPTVADQSIIAKELTVTGASAANKEYDGTTSAVISGATLVGVVNGDDVTLTNATAGTFADANVGTGKTVTTAMTITGAAIGNYTLTQPTLTANITANAQKGASSIIFSSTMLNETIQLTWKSGNGERCAIFVKESKTGKALPLDSTTYTVNTVNALNSQIGTTGWYCCYNGSGNSATITGLKGCCTYIFHVIEYRGIAGKEVYYTDSTTANNAKVYSTNAFKESDNPLSPVLENIVAICPDENGLLKIKNPLAKYEYFWYKNNVALNTVTSTVYTAPLSKDKYQVEVWSGACYVRSDSIAIPWKTAPAKPTIITNNGPYLFTLYCPNETASYYQWYYEGQAIAGANKYEYSTRDKMGAYFVEIKETGKECSVKSNVLTIPLTTTAISGIHTKDVLKLSPIPATDKLILNIAGIYNGKYEVLVIDINGKEKMRFTINKNTDEYTKLLNLNEFNAGCYYIKLSNKNGLVQIGKFVKQ